MFSPQTRYKKAGVILTSRLISFIYGLQECDLPADRPYLFGYHPHGKVSVLRCTLTELWILSQASSACRLTPTPPNPTMLNPKFAGAPCATLPTIPLGSPEVSRACAHISLPSIPTFRSRFTARFFCCWACVPFRSDRARGSCAREM